jgi:hypothetical protein
MPQTRPNKATTPINADAYNLTADLATMADSLNVIIKVASQSERDALTVTAGTSVARTDLAGAPLQTYDGTQWNQQGGTQTVLVSTGTEARPVTSSTVFWKGGTTRPTNIASGDIWFKAGS